MPSRTDIANYALGLIAEETITSLEEDNESARKCSLHLNQTIREVSAMAPWKCVAKRQSLARLGSDPSFGWGYQYALPSDYIKVISFNDVELDYVLRFMFTVEGINLLTNETTAKLLYVHDITSVDSEDAYGVLDPLMVKSIYTMLAAKLAWHLQQNRTQQMQLMQTFETELRRAKSQNARGAFMPRESLGSSSDWVYSRYTGTGA
ncbi:MAG: hypothetical protein Unbinned1322contig1001_6 [Prokaryotic dsDNA virus sp.]|nr:MAG: hypothetical protein Unbinned1322contig1001_6 [Prokaryotic dsDNA virus sp.]|tara:strand:- start:12093 stop:12710 length:618 start_codon:yes stop_codon:yes gene_type:complete